MQGKTDAVTAKQKGRSRRNQLLRLIIGTTTLVLSTTAYYSYQIVRSLVLDNLKENAFLEVKQGVDEIDGWLATLKDRVETQTNSPLLRTMDWEAIEPYLQLEVARQTDFYKFDLVAPDGSYSNTIVGRAQRNLSDRAYFPKAMAGKVVVSDPVISRSTGFPLILIVVPIWSMPALKQTTQTPEQQEIITRSLLALNIPLEGNQSAKPLGLLLGSLKTDRVKEIVSQLEYGDRSYAFALNSQGRAISHPNPDLMSTKDKPAPSFLESSNEDLAAIAEQMVKGEQGIELVQLDDNWQYVAYLPLQQANWSVALVIPRANIESQLGLLDTIALAMLGLAFIMNLVIWQVQSFEQTQLKKSEAALEQQNQQLQETLDQLKQTQALLVQAEKMSSLGEMVAGIAHEINNPVNFIVGNLAHAEGYTQSLIEMLHLYEQYYREPAPEIQARSHELELEFICEDLSQLIGSMKFGTDRIQEIVLSMRNFARTDAVRQAADINQGLDSTLLLLRHRLQATAERPQIELLKEYGNLPLVHCYPGLLNQVFMNILANAIDALSDAVSQGMLTEQPRIKIVTEVGDSEQVIIRIQDNGIGMTEAVRSQLFESFFTTKPVGKGTGLGLSISHQVVVDKHGGTLTCTSELGKGTEFAIAIPLK